MELDIGDAAVLVDEGVGVHAKALHVAVVQRNAHIILQEGELRPYTLIRISALGAQRKLVGWPHAYVGICKSHRSHHRPVVSPLEPAKGLIK